MPPKKSNLNNASSNGSRRKRVERAQQLPEQIETRNAAQRIRTAESRAQESQEQRDERLQQNITRTRAARERNIATVRVLDRQRQRISRSLTRASFVRLAFEYAPDINYSAHSKIAIGGMDKVCQYCQALKFRNEAAGMCCASGKVVLSPLPAPPEPLLSLLTGNSDDSKLFLRKIRKFNSCFQMTSFGATKICDRASDGRNFETTFKIQGQVYHKIGSLMPMPDNNPKFLQIYFMGDCEERVTTRCLYNFIEQAEERAIVILLENFLEDHNQLIQLIKRVSPRLQNDNYQIVIKADKVPLGEHAGRFNAPTVDEVAVIMVGDPVDKRSIKITRRDNTVSMISDLHRSYDALQYPLIFWQGQDEYHLNIKQYDPNTGDYRNNKVSSMNYYAHRIMVRQHQDNYILRYRQLFHQYIVDMYAKVESERLRFLRFNQAKLRSEEYIHLRDAVAGNIDGNLNPNDIGNAFILPSSYIGSPRNMQEYIQDAMTYVRHYGRPDLFITFTCNPNWEEIQTLLLPGQQAIHRHDLTAQWQKRGLPHAHILVWLKDRIRPEEIDQIISAEIPDPLIDQELFDIVTKHMIHGPCGAFNMTSPCMENGKCKKKFPKPHTNDTITDIDGYPMYRRRSSDLAIFEVQNINKNDEIARYQMGRYISSNEAIWHILSFPIHERDPAVQHLAIHLENGQRVYFTEENVLQRAFEAPKTTLTEFFTLCQKPDVFGQFAKTLVYGDVPRYFTWNKSSKKWEPRKQGKPHPSITGIFKAKTLGRLYTVHPKQRECFYLRLLLDACRELQLLEDDNHWDLTLADAALTSTPNNIRQLFAIILTTCYPSQAQSLWEKYKNCMTEDILHRIRQTNQCQNIDYTPEMYNETLVLIEDLCVLISNLPLNHYGMPSPNRPATDLVNTDLQRENQYDHGSLATIIMNSEPLLTAEQKIIYDRIMLAVAAEQGGFFFLDAPGGTGKTFLISLILAKIRSQQKIALAVASSGIAATLLDGGRTAHSTFKLPLDVHNKPDAICNIKKNSGIAAVLRKSSIIIWDECTMAHKYSLEALNRTMQDLNSNNKLFGGAILLLSGDFRQTLPVIPRSTFADEINACLKQSFLWRSVEILRLTINMRVQLQNDPSAQIFSEQLLDIGNGKIELQPNTQCIKLPDNFCTVVQDKNELIQSIFPDIQNNYLNHEWLSQRAILAAKNVDVDEINFQIQQLLPGDLMSFKSIDTVVDENESVNFPIEFLNSLDIPGMPPHNLRLKIGSPIILLRNLNPPQLCNGTRLVIKKITGNILETTILAGKFKGKVVLLPRIPMIPSDSTIPFKRLQFPIRLAFAMSINKSQGQTMSICGLDLENPCFSHGQLYVACSRVGKPSNLFVLAKDRLTKNIVHRLVLH
ncbi:unnamed protein product [Arctia plantaginis]|nr:unnamed protein product [Arctia plantaginis]CAB3260582.1 unnamed protein product [Arctia plantaginis]